MTTGRYITLAPGLILISGFGLVAQVPARQNDPTLGATSGAIFHESSSNTHTPVIAAQIKGDGIAPEVWSQIAPQVERASYEFQPQADAVIARNHAQDFCLAADPAGLNVNGALRLRAVALNGELLPDAEPVADGQRLEYRRGAVMEWFENRAEGLEQGFVLKPQTGNLKPEHLNLDVKFETELRVTVVEDGQAVLLTDAKGGAQYRYAGLKVTDANHQPVGSFFQSPIKNPKSQIVRIVCNASRAQFPITIDPVLTSMAKKLLAPDGAAGDALGLAVAVDGDVAVVGAPSDDDAGTTSGSAYVFERNAGGTNTWKMIKKLTAADGAAYDDFGLSVAVAGDVIVVGAHWDDDKGSDSGSAYVFERNAGLKTNEWRQVAKLTAPDGAEGDDFGVSVAVDGDVAVVGAGAKFLLMGAAYVFERNAGMETNKWDYVAKLTASDAGRGDFFGHAVAVCGDVVVAGAYGRAAQAGAAYVFERNAGLATNQWRQVQEIVPLDALDDCRFGYSVAVCGDVIVGGAYGDAGVGADAGAAYVFERNAGLKTNEWQQVRKIIASDRYPGDQFGISVAAAGDLVVVGANLDDDLGNDSGSAYVFERNAGGTNRWGQVQKLRHPTGAAGDKFGSAVAAGGGLILAGASGDDDLGANSGSACVFPAQREDWTETKKLLAADGAAGDLFGDSVAVAGDVAVVGAHWGNDQGDKSGSAYVFERNAGGTNNWGQVKKLLAADGAAGKEFGRSMAAAGDVAVVGAAYGDSAYVFERNAGGTNNWGQVKKLLAADGAADDDFGRSVAVAGDVAVVAAYLDDDMGSGSGAAYVFERNAGGTNRWEQVKKLLAADGAADDAFGNAVAAGGDIAVVGAPYDDDMGSGSGSAYVFERNAGGTNNWGQVKKLLAADGTDRNSFGYSVAVAGDVVLVGAPEDDDAGLGSGSTYIFERNAGGTNNWGQVAKLIAPDSAGGARFGDSVAVAGDLVVVVATYDATPLGGDGSAYVFERNAGGTNNWGQVKQFQPPPGTIFGHNAFGESVAIEGDVFVVGNHYYDGMFTHGSAYVFEGTLFGPPTITNITVTEDSVFLSWPCQPAWLYDVEITRDLVSVPWLPVSGALKNLPGNDGGSMTVEDSIWYGTAFRRLRRHAP